MHKKEITPMWLDIKTACQMFSISKPTLLKIIYNGEIIASKKLGKWLICKDSLNQYFMEDHNKLELLKSDML